MWIREGRQVQPSEKARSAARAAKTALYRLRQQDSLYYMKLLNDLWNEIGRISGR